MGKKTLLVMSLALVVLLAAQPAAQAGYMDGKHWFSLDSDTAAGGVNGDMYWTPEDGTFQWGGNMALEYYWSGGSPQIDALSGNRHDPVTLNQVIAGNFQLLHSIDGDSDIYEWKIGGPPIPAAPRAGILGGSFANVAPREVFPTVHDDENDLGLGVLGNDDTLYDLDALESSHNGQDFAGSVYFSVERAGYAADRGDVYVWEGTSPTLYVDDMDLALAIPGLDPGFDQLDALVVFDVAGEEGTFDEGTSLYDSDAILFSLASGGLDLVGDNVYWYSAAAGGMGGLYFDPVYQYNVDALDVHPVPEPASLLLLGSGLIGLAGFGRKKKEEEGRRGLAENFDFVLKPTYLSI